jgi:hypothetical protein
MHPQWFAVLRVLLPPYFGTRRRQRRTIQWRWQHHWHLRKQQSAANCVVLLMPKAAMSLAIHSLVCIQHNLAVLHAEHTQMQCPRKPTAQALAYTLNRGPTQQAHASKPTLLTPQSTSQ